MSCIAYLIDYNVSYGIAAEFRDRFAGHNIMTVVPQTKRSELWDSKTLHPCMHIPRFYALQSQFICTRYLNEAV